MAGPRQAGSAPRLASSVSRRCFIVNLSESRELVPEALCDNGTHRRWFKSGAGPMRHDAENDHWQKASAGRVEIPPASEILRDHGVPYIEDVDHVYEKAGKVASVLVEFSNPPNVLMRHGLYYVDPQKADFGLPPREWGILKAMMEPARPASSTRVAA